MNLTYQLFKSQYFGFNFNPVQSWKRDAPAEQLESKDELMFKKQKCEDIQLYSENLFKQTQQYLIKMENKNRKKKWSKKLPLSKFMLEN